MFKVIFYILIKKYSFQKKMSCRKNDYLIHNRGMEMAYYWIGNEKIVPHYHITHNNLILYYGLVGWLVGGWLEWNCAGS